MYLPVEPGRLIGGRKIEDALYYHFCGCIMWLFTEITYAESRRLWLLLKQDNDIHAHAFSFISELHGFFGHVRCNAFRTDSACTFSIDAHLRRNAVVVSYKTYFCRLRNQNQRNDRDGPPNEGPRQKAPPSDDDWTTVRRWRLVFRFSRRAFPAESRGAVNFARNYVSRWLYRSGCVEFPVVTFCLAAVAGSVLKPIILSDSAKVGQLRTTEPKTLSALLCRGKIRVTFVRILTSWLE